VHNSFIRIWGLRLWKLVKGRIMTMASQTYFTAGGCSLIETLVSYLTVEIGTDYEDITLTHFVKLVF